MCHPAAGHVGEDIVAAGWSRGGRVLATAAKVGLKFWNREGTELKHGEFSDVRVSPGGLAFSQSHLYTSENGSISRREMSIEGERMRLGPRVELLSGFSDGGQIVLTPDESSLAFALDGGVELLHLASNRRTKFADPPPATVCLAVSPDGEWLAAGSGTVGEARVWPIGEPEKGFALEVAGPPAVVFYPLAIFPNAGSPGTVIPPHLMTGDSEAYRVWTVEDQVWSTNELKAIPSKMHSRGGYLPRMVFSPRGTSLTISYDRKSLKVLRPNGTDLTDWVLMTQPGFDDQSPLAVSSPSGRLMATEDTEGRLNLWDFSEVVAAAIDYELHWPERVKDFGPEPGTLIRPSYAAEKSDMR